MSAFILKIIALISMTIDHSSYLIFGKFSFLNFIGRFAFPIFAFQVSEGYIHTRNLKKYLLRLFVFALISQIPFWLYFSTYSSNIGLNIFFTLLLGLISIIIYDKLDNLSFSKNYIHYLYRTLGIICAVAISWFSSFINCDYGYFGVAIIFIFFLFKKHKLLMNIAFIICTFIYYFKNLFFTSLFEVYLLLFICTLVPLVFINLYNNTKGKDIKHILYLFYPLHLIILYVIDLIL